MFVQWKLKMWELVWRCHIYSRELFSLLLCVEDLWLKPWMSLNVLLLLEHIRESTWWSLDGLSLPHHSAPAWSLRSADQLLREVPRSGLFCSWPQTLESPPTMPLYCPLLKLVLMHIIPWLLAKLETALALVIYCCNIIVVVLWWF